MYVCMYVLYVCEQDHGPACMYSLPNASIPPIYSDGRLYIHDHECDDVCRLTTKTSQKERPTSKLLSL